MLKRTDLVSRVSSALNPLTDICGCPDTVAAAAVSAVAEFLWEQARSKRDGYPGNGHGIEYINGWEDAATFLEVEARAAGDRRA